jgi:hypothetical protein
MRDAPCEVLREIRVVAKRTAVLDVVDDKAFKFVDDDCAVGRELLEIPTNPGTIREV